MKVTVFGCGYLGATHAACMAELGHEVLASMSTRTRSRCCPTGASRSTSRLPEVLQRNLESGRLHFTSDYDEAAAFASVHFLEWARPEAR